jgi:polar amino acid transport system substrate-binding protein
MALGNRQPARARLEQAITDGFRSYTMRFVGIAAAFAASVFAFGAGAAELPDLGGRTVRAVTENAYVPLNFADPKSGEGIGWEYDAFNEIAKRLNLKVEWNLSSWDTMIQAVREGQFDIGMDGITINDERKAQVDFSAPYMVSEQFMLVRADEERFADAKSFAANEELLVGAQAGTTNFYAAVYNVLDGNEQNPRIKLFDTFGASVQALKTGDVDLVLMDQASAAGYIGASAGAFKLVGEPLGREEFGFIFTPGSDLVAPVNAAIQSMKDDGTLEKLNRKWFYEYRAAQN